jgi:glucose/mannose transport system permease protein
MSRQLVGWIDDAVPLQTVRQSGMFRSIHFWLIPTLVVFLAIYGTIGWNFIISLTDFQGITLPAYEVSNFDVETYVQLAEDPTFWRALRNTVILMVVFPLACLSVGIFLAIIVDQKIRFENTFRTIYLLPFSLSFVVTAKFWLWMYNPEIGVINSILGYIGLDFLALNWLAPEYKLWAVMVALVWQFSGYTMVIYLAGLRKIPTAQYEAAKSDGASPLTVYLRIIIPQLRASTVSAAIVLVVFSLKAFDFLYAMFRSFPGPTADILATMMYREAFGSANWAYGSAIAMVLFGLALVIVLPYLYTEYRRGAL